MSIEQMVRDLLEQAIKDGLVYAPRRSSFGSGDPNPQARTAGDLCGVANMLNEFIHDAVMEDRKR